MESVLVLTLIVITDTTQQLTGQYNQQSTNQLGKKWDITPPCRQRLQEKSTTTLICFISSFLRWKPPITTNQQQNTQKREMWYYKTCNCLFQKAKCKLLKKHENGKEHYLTYACSPCFLMLLVWRGWRRNFNFQSGCWDFTDALMGEGWIEKSMSCW
jgi:hypothetical protein